MTILDEKDDHLNSYFDCRWAAYGTEQTAPGSLPDAYASSKKRKRHYSWSTDPPTADHQSSVTVRDAWETLDFNL